MTDARRPRAAHTWTRRPSLAALDLPLKVLVWAGPGQTNVSYYSPASLAHRHHLSAGLAGNLAGIDALTDALIAP
jgi:uncharacterized protein (DUF302 family)